MIVGELAFYGLVGVLATIATVVYAIWVWRFSGAKFKFAIIGPYMAGALAVGYFGMSVELFRLHSVTGRAVPLSRFLTYMITYTLVIAYVGQIADADRRQMLTGTFFTSLFVIGAVINWLMAPPIENVGKAMFFVALVGQLWILFGPYTRASQHVSGARQLAFGKLRNLMALLLMMYLVVGLTSRQGLGLLDTFSGVYMGAYIDLGMLGFAAILLRSETAIEHLAAEWSSPVDYFQNSGLQSPESDAPVGD